MLYYCHLIHILRFHILATTNCLVFAVNCPFHLTIYWLSIYLLRLTTNWTCFCRIFRVSPQVTLVNCPFSVFHLSSSFTFIFSYSLLYIILFNKINILFFWRKFCRAYFFKCQCVRFQ